MEYIKINSLWKREGWHFDPEKKKSPDYHNGKKFIIGDYSEPEFGNIKKWHVEEKIDGTNIRLLFKQVDGQRLLPSIMGRTSAAQIPCHLFSYLQTLATWENFDKTFTELKENDFEVYLFGEGYGPKIQAVGGNYRKDVGFILFDIMINQWWLKREDVKSIADKLSIPMAPSLGIMSEEEVIEFVKSKPLSQASMIPQMMEGVICRSEPLMLFRNGKPMIWKLKCKEFT